jgi:hypothetical protein
MVDSDAKCNTLGRSGSPRKDRIFLPSPPPSTKKWNRRVLNTIEIVYSLLHYDVLYLGGGNAANIVGDLLDNVRVASNDAGITGGIHLWDEDLRQAVRGSGRSPRAPAAREPPAS